MKRVILALMLALTMAFSACSGQKAAELYETAQFEEKQNNREHAEKLYTEIIQKYPDSEFAQKAKERLTVIREK